MLNVYNRVVNDNCDWLNTNIRIIVDTYGFVTYFITGTICSF